jgi:hypothetical protein
MRREGWWTGWGGGKQREGSGASMWAKKGREGKGKEEEEEGGVARRAQELFLMGRKEEGVGEGVKERRRGEGR